MAKSRVSSRFIVSKRQRFRLCDRTPSVCHGGMLGAGASHPAPATEPRRAGQNSRAKAMLTLWIDTTAHRSRQVTNEAGAASRHTHVQCLVGCGNSPVCEFDEHVGVAALGRARDPCRAVRAAPP